MNLKINNVLYISVTTLHLIFQIQLAHSQTNLVVNPSFEQKSCCPEKANPNHTSTTGPLSIPCLIGWSMPDRKWLCVVGSADYFNVCDYNLCPIGSHIGDGYVGLITKGGEKDQREYITSELISNLTIGHRYYVGFYVTGNSISGANIGSIGAYFSSSRPKACHESFLENEPDAHVENKTLLPYNNNWVKVEGTYVAQFNYSWITIGNFQNDANSLSSASGYLYIDDVSVIDLGYDYCPDSRLIENTTYSKSYPIIQAKNLIRAGMDVDAPSENGPVVVKNGANVIYRAGSEISLEDGFEVEEGGVFEAVIEQCSDKCPPLSINAAGIDNTVCSNTYQLGISSASTTGISYQWTPTNYLDNPYISNPIFTAPSGQGSITYILTMTNICGEQVSDKVIINYDSNPSLTPSISLNNIQIDDYVVAFDAAVSEHTEKVMIEIYNWNQSTLYYTESLKRGVDFNCCSFSWTIPEIYLSVCQDYKIKVSVKNMCSSNIATQTIDWIRNRNLSINLFPNIITPNGDGVNDKLCIDVTGADSYEVTVHDPHTNLVYQSSGTVTSNPVCVWNGTCNSLNCNSSCVNPDATYGVVVSFFSCGHTKGDRTFVYVSSPIACSGKMENTYNESDIAFVQDTIITPLSRIKYSLHPNPSNGNFELQIKNYESGVNNAVIIYDLLGREVYQSKILSPQTEINLSSQRQGVYVVKVVLGEKVWWEKMVVK